MTGSVLLDISEVRENSSALTKEFRMASAIKRFLPLFDRVLVERFAPELKTKGGIMLPEKSQGKILQATVVATGKGARDQQGNIIPPSVKPGDEVLLPEYGGTKVVLEDKEYFLFRDSDILGKFES
uniref:10 kDa heat shock protein, mitochondrial n=2 Tax=Magallana gigas TaxID=29159 RepID=A0A8W8MC84_MAGGI